MNKKKPKKPGKTLPQAVNDICTPIFSKIYGAILFLNWESVVGHHLANFSKPKSISIDKKTLVVEVERGHMLDIQYQVQYILECVHLHLHDNKIERIVLKIMDNDTKVQKDNQKFTNLMLDMSSKGTKCTFDM